MRGDDDDRHLAAAPALLHALQKIPPVDLGHGQVEQHDVGIVQHEGAVALAAVAGQEDLVAVLPQRRGEHAAQREVVVDDEDALLLDVGNPLRRVTALRLDLTHSTGRHSCRTRAQNRSESPIV